MIGILITMIGIVFCLIMYAVSNSYPQYKVLRKKAE